MAAHPNTIKNAFYEVIKSGLTKPNEQVITNFILKYLDENVEKLSTPGPSSGTLFTDANRDVIYTTLNINKDHVKEVVKSSPDIKSTWKNAADPFNIICALIICVGKNTKNAKIVEVALMYIVASMYPSLFNKYFKFKPNEQIMDYTIANLNNKFKIKQSGSIWKAMMDTVKVSDTTYTKNITNGSDKDILYYIEAIKTRLNAFMKNIRNEFEKNYRDRSSIDTGMDYNSGEAPIQNSESNAYIIERITNSIALNLSISGADQKIIETSAKLNNISVNDLRTTVQQLILDKANTKDIKNMIMAILVVYLNGTPPHAVDTIRSTTFIAYLIEVYKRSNTNDNNIKIIRFLLDKWLSMYSNRYKNTNRTATIQSFRKALFFFFIFTIQAGVK